MPILYHYQRPRKILNYLEQRKENNQSVIDSIRSLGHKSRIIFISGGNV